MNLPPSSTGHQGGEENKGERAEDQKDKEGDGLAVEDSSSKMGMKKEVRKYSFTVLHTKGIKKRGKKKEVRLQHGGREPNKGDASSVSISFGRDKDADRRKLEGRKGPL